MRQANTRRLVLQGCLDSLLFALDPAQYGVHEIGRRLTSLGFHRGHGLIDGRIGLHGIHMQTLIEADHQVGPNRDRWQLLHALLQHPLEFTFPFDNPIDYFHEEAAVSADPAGIGFIGLPYVREAKPVAVSAGDSLPMPPDAGLIATGF